MLSISCVANYTGLLAPDITWNPAPNITLPLVTTSSMVSSTVQVHVPASPDSVERYTCSVTFGASSVARKTSYAVNTSGE